MKSGEVKDLTLGSSDPSFLSKMPLNGFIQVKVTISGTYLFTTFNLNCDIARVTWS